METFKRKRYYFLLSFVVAAAIFLVSLPSMTASIARTTLPVGDIEGGAILPTGQVVTPTAAPGSTFTNLDTERRSDDNDDAAQAVTTALSPDGKTLLVLTS
ncbi:MAG: hypothetical protein ACRCZS_10400, partial [Chroococcidiopsis sp.]